MAAASQLSPSEMKQLAIIMDPANWAMSTLRDPKNSRKPLILRDYQIHMLRSKSVRKVSRCGRRIGKSLTMCVHILWYAFTHENSKQVIATPYDSQIQMIFDMLKQFIMSTPELEQGYETITKNPNVIRFKNGSTIKGFTAGTRSGSEGGSLRGQAADWLYMDEVDYMSDKDFEAIYAIALEAPERIGVWISSTPTGRRGKFYDACMNKNVWTEFYYPTMVNPEWSPAMEEDCRAMYSHSAYDHEILAEFGDETIGVFNKAFVDRAHEPYNYENYPITYNPSIIAVDWDKYGAETQIVVCDYLRDLGKIRVLNRIEIPKSDFTFDNAVNKLIELNEIYKPIGMFVDRGFGEYQIEVLRKYGLENPQSNLHKVIRPVHFSEVIKVFDPFTRRMDKKPAKHFMVNNTQILLERDRFLLNENDEMIKRQMINYQVVKKTQRGEPIYTSDDEHALDCLMLCVLGFMEKMPSEMDFLLNPKHAIGVKQLEVSNYNNEFRNVNDSDSTLNIDRENMINYQEPITDKKLKSMGVIKKKMGATRIGGRGSAVSRPHSRTKW